MGRWWGFPLSNLNGYVRVLQRRMPKKSKEITRDLSNNSPWQANATSPMLCVGYRVYSLLSRSTGERQEHKKEIRDAQTNPTQPMVALTQSRPPPAKPQRQDQCW